MAIISVPRSDTLEEFRQKFNQLSENVGDGAGVLGDSPMFSVVEYILAIQANIDVIESDIDILQSDLGDISNLQTGSPITNVVDSINSAYQELNLLQEDVGNINNLQTDSKVDLVQSVNSVFQDLSKLQSDVGDISNLEVTSPITNIVDTMNVFYTVLNDLQADLGEKIDMLVLPFYNSSSQRKDIPIYLKQL